MAEHVLRHSPLQILGWAAGWPTLVIRDDVVLREVPFVSQINLRLDPDSDVTHVVEAVLRVELPRKPNTTATTGRTEAPATETTTPDRETTVMWLGPDEWLVVGPPGETSTVEARLRQALEKTPDWGSVVDVSAHRTVLELCGPGARFALAHGCPLDLHPRTFTAGPCAQTLLAAAQVLLWQRDDAPTYWIFVRASFAPYLAEWLLDVLRSDTG